MDTSQDPLEVQPAWLVALDFIYVLSSPLFKVTLHISNLIYWVLIF